ncbi:glycosyltransferase [Coleofasciculus sp. FACHB-SPT9]|uniref:glycosyltransferase n=2 Tax=Cyanobacteriota TaxID=1117 RepID=UPI0016884D09|nr:glycosyltransferase [Coleofasciculus sp. FACHB-SPT9]
MNSHPMTQPFLPRVSVIVPIYNGEADLPDLIDCLRSQTYPAESVEYLLVDNNSSDRTATLLQSAAASAAADGLTIRPIAENQIQSSYAARNAGIRASTAEIFAFTDADCRPQPQWLADLIEPFANPTIGIVVGEIMALPGNTLLEQYADRENVLSQKHSLANPFCPYGQTANLAIRRKALEQVGLFRPYLTTGGDADICWRIQRESDWQLHFAPTAIVRHRHRSTFQELQSQLRRYGRSNRYLHELHGVKLTANLSAKEYLYRLSRWLVKEVPVTGVKAIAGKAALVDLLRTPINLINVRARAAGQNEARLPEAAKVIEWLEKPQDVEVNP